jgi:GR25 family glycosyltransferase involved in LPS biosynthesis
MIHACAEAPSRLFTALGTVLFVDPVSRELRHGPVESSPANAFFVRDPSLPGRYSRGCLAYDTGNARESILCEAHGGHSPMQTGGGAHATTLDLIPLERGLIAFRTGDLFLSAIPDGRITLAAPVCSTWELFLASEASYGEASAEGEPAWEKQEKFFNRRDIKSYLVHPLIRVRTNAQPKARKILIYGYTKWSHGRVYYDLCKYLYKNGYIVDILDWQVNHREYFDVFHAYYDIYMTALDGVRTLIEEYHVPREKIIAISHSEFDIRMLTEQLGVEVFENLGAYGVVSEFLYGASSTRGISRVPMLAPIAVNYSEFYSDVSEGLATVGYASSMAVETFGVEWKRGVLAEAAAKAAGLPFKVAGWTGGQTLFHDMPDFYRGVDALLVSSVTESGPLTVMEAAAAGRLVIGTPVGHFPRKAYEGGGILAPIEPEKFKAFATETLLYYKDNPRDYIRKCRTIQHTARKFDWQYSIQQWIELIEAGAGNCTPTGTDRAFHLGTTPAAVRTNSSSFQRESSAFIGQAHVINLDRSVDRLAKFKQRNSFLDFTRVSAVDAALVDREQLVKDGIISEDLSYAPGSLGCALSHVGLWKKAVDENKIMTIFEDDIICSLSFNEESERILSTLPEDWDIVQWGANFNPLFVWLDFGFSKARLEFYDYSYSGDAVAFQRTRHAPSPLRIAHSFGAMAYSVSPKGARTLIEHCLPLRNRIITFPGAGVTIDDTGIDCPMCGAYGFMQAFICLPPLVVHDDEQTSDRIEAGG